MKNAQFVINGLFANVEKDDYEHGCDIASGMNKQVDIIFKADSIQSLIDKVSEFGGSSDYMVNPCEDEPSRIDWQVMENVDGLPANSSDIELWKVGKRDLYLVDYTAIVQQVIDVDVETVLAKTGENL